MNDIAKKTPFGLFSGKKTSKVNKELHSFLKANSLSQYEVLLASSGFDGPDALQLLAELSDKDLKEIGMKKLGHRRQLLSALETDNSNSKTSRRESVLHVPKLKEKNQRTRPRPLIKNINPIVVTPVTVPFTYLNGLIYQSAKPKPKSYFFHIICEATHDKLPVMVKFINPSMLQKYFPLLFQFEAILPNIHYKLQSLSTECGLDYYGIVKDKGTYGFVISKPSSNLQEWLKERNIDDLDEKDKTLMTSFSIEVSSALEFVHSQNWFVGLFTSKDVYLSSSFCKKAIEAKLDIFSPIALTDILAKEYNCKIPKSEKRCRLDFAFCSPEVLQKRNFSISGDVWCYSVLLWEIWSLGDIPYDGVLDQKSTKSIQSFVSYICKADSPKLTLECNSNSTLDYILAKSFIVESSKRITQDKITIKLKELQ